MNEGSVALRGLKGREKENLIMGHARALLCFLPVTLLACSEKLVSLEEVTSTTLGVAGGQAQSAARELTLDFEADTLPEGTVIRIRTQRDRPNLSLSSVEGFAVYELTAEPPIAAFSKPVAISIKVKPIGDDPGFVVANFDGASPIRLSSTYDRNNHVARAELEHFSSYGPWIGATTPTACPSTAPSGVGACGDEGLRCEYGQECCCGVCHPAEVWQCSGGTWAGHATDACLGAAIQCPDSGVSTDGGDQCVGSEFCLSGCGSDALASADCVGGAWVCDPGWIAVSRQDELCVGQLSGPCRAGGTPCDLGLGCGNDNRCYPECIGTATSTPAADHLGRCRASTGNPVGCCSEDPIDGLCGIQLQAFYICPQGSLLATTCTSSPSQPCD